MPQVIVGRWQLYLTVLAVACLPMGLIWDISWHVSIGRDTFWAPAHIVIQLGGIIPALLFASHAVRTTFWGSTEERKIAITGTIGCTAPALFQPMFKRRPANR